MKVIKHGNFYFCVKCPTCSCEFEASAHEMKFSKNCRGHFFICPECDHPVDMNKKENYKHENH